MVAQLKREYEAWFADVTKQGFAPPRIALGNEKLQAALLSIPLELARITHELKAGLQEFHNGLKVPGGRYVELDAAHLSNIEAEAAFTGTLLDFLE